MRRETLFDRKTLTVCAYDPTWNLEFQAIAAVLRNKLGTDTRIEHVGSTSVPGLPAKPVLDIDLIVGDLTAMEDLKPPLAELGYTFRGDLGIPLRYAFRRADPQTPWTEPRRDWLAQNLYVCIEGSLALKNHRLLRDILRARSDLRDGYGRLKQDLAARFAHLPYAEAIDPYCEAKTPFILSILATDLTAAEQAEIEESNRA